MRTTAAATLLLTPLVIGGGIPNSIEERSPDSPTTPNSPDGVERRFWHHFSPPVAEECTNELYVKGPRILLYRDSRDRACSDLMTKTETSISTSTVYLAIDPTPEASVDPVVPEEEFEPLPVIGAPASAVPYEEPDASEDSASATSSATPPGSTLGSETLSTVTDDDKNLVISSPAQTVDVTPIATATGDVEPPTNGTLSARWWGGGRRSRGRKGRGRKLKSWWRGGDDSAEEEVKTPDHDHATPQDHTHDTEQDHHHDDTEQPHDHDAGEAHDHHLSWSKPTITALPTLSWPAPTEICRGEGMYSLACERFGFKGDTITVTAVEVVTETI